MDPINHYINLINKLDDKRISYKSFDDGLSLFFNDKGKSSSMAFRKEWAENYRITLEDLKGDVRFLESIAI